MSDSQFSAFLSKPLVGSKAKSKDKAKQVLKKGSKDAAYFALLKRYSGEKTVSELAALVGMDADTMKSTVSRVLGKAKNMGISADKLSEILPAEYIMGQGRGRTAAENMSQDDVLAMLDAPAEDIDLTALGIADDSGDDSAEV